jgi:hypothetical protein
VLVAQAARTLGAHLVRARYERRVGQRGAIEQLLDVQPARAGVGQLVIDREDALGEQRASGLATVESALRDAQGSAPAPVCP